MNLLRQEERCIPLEINRLDIPRLKKDRNGDRTRRVPGNRVAHSQDRHIPFPTRPLQIKTPEEEELREVCSREAHWAG